MCPRARGGRDGDHDEHEEDEGYERGDGRDDDGEGARAAEGEGLDVHGRYADDTRGGLSSTIDDRTIAAFLGSKLVRETDERAPR